MSAEPIVIPIVSDLDVEHLEFLKRLHVPGPGLMLVVRYSGKPISFGDSSADGFGPHSAVTELLRLADFALHLQKVAENAPNAPIADVITDVFQHLRSR